VYCVTLTHPIQSVQNNQATKLATSIHSQFHVHQFPASEQSAAATTMEIVHNPTRQPIHCVNLTLPIQPARMDPLLSHRVIPNIMAFHVQQTHSNRVPICVGAAIKN
jgi:hypothetical protein